jgi:hypothetical protein
LKIHDIAKLDTLGQRFQIQHQPVNNKGPLDDWMLIASTLPKEKTLRQRDKYFPKLHFSSLTEMISRVSEVRNVEIL